MVRVSRLARYRVFAAALFATGVMAGCDGKAVGPDALSASVDDFLSGVAVVGSVDATLDPALSPEPGTGPVLTASASSGFITGGTTQVQLSSPVAFQSVIIRVAGASGFYRVDLPAPVTAVTLEVSVLQEPIGQRFTIEYAAVAAGGAVGTYAGNAVRVIRVGTGPVQVSLSWNSAADLDLYLVEPGGAEIYYGNKLSAAGGSLDLDSNAACSAGDVRNENITYPNGTPPTGTYTVRVNHWSNCSAASTNYVVTVHVQGQALRTFSGSFSGAGVGGGLGAGVVITTFTR